MIPSSFYEDQVRSANIFRRWIHKRRYAEINRLVHQYRKIGASIYDCGAASSTWNTDKLPVHAFDYNEGALILGNRLKQNSQYTVCDMCGTGMPDSSGDILVATESIEHVPDHTALLKEMRRIMKHDGILILSVPYDQGFSLWWALFPIHTFFMGRLKKNPYYVEDCGHHHHFSPDSLRKTL